MPERVRVDETDLRILREIFLGEAESLRGDRVAIDAIAKTLGLHRNTVSQRVKRLTEKGVFLPASLDVEPGKIGLVATIAHLDLPPERRTDSTREALFAVPGVETLIALTDGWMVIAYGEDEATLEARLVQMQEAVGAPHARLEMWSTRDYAPATPVKLSDIDARLLVLLLEDARAPFPLLAERLGTTAMTAQRRYERLRDDGTLYLLPSSSAPIEGVVMAWLIIDLPHQKTEPVAKAALQKLLPDTLVRNLATKGRAHFILFARTLDDLEASARAARQVEGVAAVHLTMLSSITTNPRYAAWMATKIRARVEVSKGGSPPA